MIEEIIHSDQINEIAKALSQLQGRLSAVTRDAKNPYFSSKYATLAAVRGTINPLLCEFGLALTQLPNGDFLTSLLVHTSGQWIRSDAKILNTKGDAQGMGSAITYASRYAAMSILGIAAEDDDGNAASSRPPQQTADEEAKSIVAQMDKIQTVTELTAYAQRHKSEWLASLGKGTPEFNRVTDGFIARKMLLSQDSGADSSG
jgi:hypothetical protein